MMKLVTAVLLLGLALAWGLGPGTALFTDTQSVADNTFGAGYWVIQRVGSWSTGLTNFTAGSGSNRVVILAVGYENGPGDDPGVSTVTLGGNSLTRIVGAVAGGAAIGRVELWYMPEASIPVGSNNFVVTWGGTAPAFPMYAAATYANVDQTSPITDSAGTFTDSSTPNPITQSVSVVANGMAVAAAISGKGGSYSWGGGWTEGTDQTAGNTTTMSSADNPATADGTDTASATHSDPNRQALVVASLRNQ